MTQRLKLTARQYAILKRHHQALTLATQQWQDSLHLLLADNAPLALALQENDGDPYIEYKDSPKASDTPSGDQSPPAGDQP